MADTEIRLKIWRGDQIKAERLAAAILHIEGFSSVDPQCPLGGPDGLKDVLCEKNAWKYVAAAYFPTSDQTFSKVQDKYLHDLVGVTQNRANGLIFITNQGLTPSERKVLVKLATDQGHTALIYHLERVRAILDSPSGYGVRLEYLGIEMELEDQLSFFSKWDQSFSDRLQEQSLLIIREISKKIDSLAGPAEVISQQVFEFASAAKQTISELGEILSPSNKSSFQSSFHGCSTGQLTVDELCLLHKALLFDAPQGTQLGVLRNRKVWIAGSSSRVEDATFIPPEPGLVAQLLRELLQQWRDAYSCLEKDCKSAKLDSITRFHHGFLNIHPFLDGNGRLARFILSQQASELFGVNRRVVIEDRRPYFEALRKADDGDYADLTAVLTQAIFGVELVTDGPCSMSGMPCSNCKTGVLDIMESEAGVQCNNCGFSIYM